MFDVYKQANLTKTFSTTAKVDIRLGLRSVYMFTKCTVMLTLPFQIKLNNYLTRPRNTMVSAMELLIQTKALFLRPIA